MNVQLLVIKPQSQHSKQKEKLCCLSDTTRSEEEGMPGHTLDITLKQLQELCAGALKDCGVSLSNTQPGDSKAC